MFELKGYNKNNELEFLGVYDNKKKALEAFDSYWAMGYRKLEINKRSIWRNFLKKFI